MTDSLKYQNQNQTIRFGADLCLSLQERRTNKAGNRKKEAVFRLNNVQFIDVQGQTIKYYFTSSTLYRSKLLLIFEIFIALMTCKMIIYHYITNNTAMDVGSVIPHIGAPKLHVLNSTPISLISFEIFTTKSIVRL